MGPATAEKSKAQLFEEKAKLKELRRYTRELLKERDELHASLEAGSAASSSEADEARAAREAQLREAHDALQREHDAVVERLREAELAAADGAEPGDVAVPVALEPIYDELLNARGRADNAEREAQRLQRELSVAEELKAVSVKVRSLCSLSKVDSPPPLAGAAGVRGPAPRGGDAAGPAARAPFRVRADAAEAAAGRAAHAD